jgi:hypothetical protein
MFEEMATNMGQYSRLVAGVMHVKGELNPNDSDIGLVDGFIISRQCSQLLGDNIGRYRVLNPEAKDLT